MAIAAIAALLLSAFAFAQPTAATHDGGFDHQPLPIDTSTFAHDSGECDDVDLLPGEVLLHFVATQQNTTDAIALSLSYAAGGSATVDSTKWNEPGQINSNVTHHFYVTVDGDVVITDLDISTSEGNVRLSHVCRADGEQPDEQPGDNDAALNIFKLIEDTTTRLPGAIFEIDGMDGTFVTDENGQICITGLPDDSEWLVREIQAPAGYEIIEAEQLVEVDNDGDCDSPDARFYNRPVGGEQPGDTTSISIMKHLCADIETVAEFEALEAAAAVANPENPVAPLVATVLACPTIVLTADIPMDEDPAAGHVNFDFTVEDADGTQVLSSDGTFMNGQLCETDVNLDADASGTIDADVCLDVSHYTFTVVDGLVEITESNVPSGSTFGTIRFTPGSDDAATLVGTIAEVETSGVITIDTTADTDGSVMIHAYNFVAGAAAPAEGTQGGNPTPREDTLAGTLPDTAAPSGHGSIPAAILALLIVGALGVTGQRAAVEVHRRR